MVEEFFKSISIVFYEALCCGIFLNMFLEQRYPARWLKSLSVFLLTGVFLFWALITQTGGHYVFRSIGIIISIALFAVIFYTGKWLLKIFLSFIFYAILFCVDYLGLILVDLLLDSADLSNSVIQVILVLLCKTVSFGMVSINLVMFVLLKYISAREKQYNQMKILQERNKEKMQAYYEFSEDYAQKKRMVHDYNNQIHCIQGLLRQNKYREAEEYADKLTEILIDGREVIDVNNTVLNVVLNQKYRLAKSKDIALYFQVNDLSGLWMKEQDVVILLSNLLDNAIEACEKLDCNKVIRLKLVKEKQQMVLSVQNPVAVPVEIKNNDIQTGKGDKKNHGIGLKNIQMVLDKYGGKDSSICCFVLYCLYSKKTYRRNHLYCFLYGCKADYRWFSCKKFFGMSDRISINIINGIRNNCSVNRKV